jgi:transcriptional regulator with XRE-family HTH domain
VRKPSDPPRQTLAANLKMLMAETRLSGAEVSRLAGISSKSVNNMLHARHSPNLDDVEKVAAVFSLNLWQLILPGLRSDLAKNGHLDALMQHYAESSAEGRANIDRVAELEARYNIGK